MGAGAHVFWLFLDPDDFFCVRVACDRAEDLLCRQWAQQLHACDRGFLRLLVERARREVEVDVAAGQQQALHTRLVAGCVARVVDYLVELAGGELVDRAVGSTIAEQRFRRHDDERIRLRGLCLRPQQVEVLCRGRAVRNTDVAFSRDLQEPFEPRAGVLRAGAFVAVRQQQR